MKNTVLWFWGLTKRLLCRRGFLAVLLLLPLLLPLGSAMMRGDSGVLHIALCAEEGTARGKEIVETLAREESILEYTLYASAQAARTAVLENRADAAWIFEADFDTGLIKYAAKKARRLPVLVVEREETVPLRLSHEKLYGALYPHIARETYAAFVEAEFSGEAPLRYYESTEGGREVIRVERLYGGETAGQYLTAPLRGLLSLVVMLCGMAAAMYFLEDVQKGRYDWLSPRRHSRPALFTCLGALLLGGTAQLLALCLAEMAGAFLYEAACTALFIFCALGFCMVLCALFRRPGILGAALPFFFVTMLALCPIFFNMKILRPVRLLLPPYYYLQAAADPRYLLYMLFYGVCALLVAEIGFKTQKIERTKGRKTA